jgi:acyl-CoA reductase-like NAD-dependent aldehyde dehydrogenase
MTRDDEHGAGHPARPRRAEREQDLRATTDAIRQDADRLAAIETEKQGLAPEDPRLDELSDAAVAAADRINHETRAERQLVRELG